MSTMKMLALLLEEN